MNCFRGRELSILAVKDIPKGTNDKTRDAKNRIRLLVAYDQTYFRSEAAATDYFVSPSARFNL